MAFSQLTILSVYGAGILVVAIVLYSTQKKMIMQLLNRGGKDEESLTNIVTFPELHRPRIINSPRNYKSIAKGARIVGYDETVKKPLIRFISEDDKDAPFIIPDDIHYLRLDSVISLFSSSERPVLNVIEDDPIVHSHLESIASKMKTKSMVAQHVDDMKGDKVVAKEKIEYNRNMRNIAFGQLPNQNTNRFGYRPWSSYSRFNPGYGGGGSSETSESEEGG